MGGWGIWTDSLPALRKVTADFDTSRRLAIVPLALDRQCGELERVGLSRPRSCDPGRAHRLLRPRLPQWIETTQESTSLTSFSDPSAEQSIKITSTNGNALTTSLPLLAIRRDAEKQRQVSAVGLSETGGRSLPDRRPSLLYLDPS